MSEQELWTTLTKRDQKLYVKKQYLRVALLGSSTLAHREKKNETKKLSRFEELRGMSP